MSEQRAKSAPRGFLLLLSPLAFSYVLFIASLLQGSYCSAPRSASARHASVGSQRRSAWLRTRRQTARPPPPQARPPRRRRRRHRHRWVLDGVWLESPGLSAAPTIFMITAVHLRWGALGLLHKTNAAWHIGGTVVECTRNETGVCEHHYFFTLRLL